MRLTARGSQFRSGRFPFIPMAVGKLPVRSCLIDGEAIVWDENGLAIFDLIRRHGASASAVLCAFDLLELDGRDLRRRPIEERKGLLAKLLNGQQTSIVLNQVYEGDGATVFHLACQLGCEGIVSRQLGARCTGARRTCNQQVARCRQILDATCEAAAELGNTPAICRKSYVHETVVSAFENGALEGFAETLRATRSTAKRAKVLAKVAAQVETDAAA
jgi:ATP dependent DNA ligase domain